MTDRELIYYLTWLVDKAGSQKRLAEILKISPTYLNDVINERRAPGKKLLDAIHFKATTTYDYVDPISNSDWVKDTFGKEEPK